MQIYLLNSTIFSNFAAKLTKRNRDVVFYQKIYLPTGANRCQSA